MLKGVILFLLFIVLAAQFPYWGIDLAEFTGWSDTAIVAIKVLLILGGIYYLLKGLFGGGGDR